MPTGPCPPLLRRALIACTAAGALIASAGAWAQQDGSRPVRNVQVRAAAVPDAPLSDAELAIAANVYVGQLPCELGQTVVLQPDPSAPGYFYLQLREHRFRVRPVVSSTGAVRLEDRAQGAVWIQLSNKSMLMNQKQGRRMADECAGPVQRAAAEHLRLNPIPHLLDVAQTPRQ
jgi:hypothetical protein